MRKAPVKYGAWVTDGEGGAQESGAQGSDSVRGRNCGRARVYDVVPDLVGSSDEDSDEDEDSPPTATPSGPPPPRVTGPAFSPSPMNISSRIPFNTSISPLSAREESASLPDGIGRNALDSEEDISLVTVEDSPHSLNLVMTPTRNSPGTSSPPPPTLPLTPPPIVAAGVTPVRQAALQAAAREAAGLANRGFLVPGNNPGPPPPAPVPGQPPVQPSQDQPQPQSQDLPLPPLQDLPSLEDVHRIFIPTITWVPKAARAEFTRVFTSQCNRVTANPDNVSAWVLQLMFAKCILPAVKHRPDTNQSKAVKERLSTTSVCLISGL